MEEAERYKALAEQLQRQEKEARAMFAPCRR